MAKQTKKEVKYEVVYDFIDKDDNRKHYVKGKPYPRPANKKVNDERIQELLDKKAIKEME